MTEEEKKNETEEKFLETIKERGIGYKLPNGNVVEVSHLDEHLVEILVCLLESVHKIEKNVG